MERQDEGMPFLLRYENVAWYEDGKVRILDRRVFPRQRKFVVCDDYHGVIKAIQDMVTQSAGPFTAVGMGMALAAYQCKDEAQEKQVAFLTKAADELGNARPTTANRYSAITHRALKKQLAALKEGRSAVEAAFNDTIDSLNRRYATEQKIGDNFVSLLSNNSSFLTHCYAETVIGCIIRAAKKQGKTLKAYDTATEPFFQGAKLTASCFQEGGFETTMVPDNMVNFVLERGDIDVFTTAADKVTMDGYLTNKIGTKQNAILCNRVGVPYFPTELPDLDTKTHDGIKIEMRDPEGSLEFEGKKYVMDGVKSIYPAFDITPPYLISALVTDRGVFSPYNLAEYAKMGGEDFY